MASEVLGIVSCPHCGTDATVHRQASRNAKLYYRCYDGPNGACGTIQITLEGGQRWINDNMRPLTGLEAQQAAQEAADVARESQLKVAGTKLSNGLFHALFRDEDE